MQFLNVHYPSLSFSVSLSPSLSLSLSQAFGDGHNWGLVRSECEGVEVVGSIEGNWEDMRQKEEREKK